MKKIINVVICIAIVATMATVFVGCSNDSLYALSRELVKISETTNSMDEVADDDMEEMSGSLTINNSEVFLSLDSGIENTNLNQTLVEKVDNARTLYGEIAIKKESILNMKSELQAQVLIIKEQIKEARSQNIELTDEEHVIIEEYINELKNIREILTATIGNAYLRMHALKGSYNLGNIDTIVTTFSEVNDVLTIRVESLERLQEIATDLDILLSSKINIE